jgi:hypothetical protein
MKAVVKVKLVNSEKLAIFDKSVFENLPVKKFRCDKNGYIYMEFKKWDFTTVTPTRWRSIIQVHRWILAAPLNLVVDHKNFNPLDNRVRNLRLATRGQNQCNRRLQSNNSFGYKGVTFTRGYYYASITSRGKYKYLGRYRSAKIAARVYDYAARRLFGEFAHLNFPRENSNFRYQSIVSRKSATGFKGVYPIKGTNKFYAQVRLPNGSVKGVGSNFSSPDEAYWARKEWLSIRQ